MNLRIVCIGNIDRALCLARVEFRHIVRLGCEDAINSLNNSEECAILVSGIEHIIIEVAHVGTIPDCLLQSFSHDVSRLTETCKVRPEFLCRAHNGVVQSSDLM